MAAPNFDYIFPRDEFDKRAMNMDRDDLSQRINALAFVRDFEAGILSSYMGTDVLYCHGILCGQNADSGKLFAEAGRHYSDLSFRQLEVSEMNYHRLRR